MRQASVAVTSDPIDRAIATLAAHQHGNVTRRQLHELGLSDGGISHRLRVGRLHRVFAGVYVVGHRPPSPLARAAAAVLASGGGAALSHASAITLWGVDDHWRWPLEVIARSSRSRDGLIVHRSRTLEAGDTTVHFGIRVTTPARTMLDVATGLGERALSRALNDARLSGRLKLSDLAGLLERSGNHPGARRLRPLLTAAHERPTRSELEDRFLAFTRRYSLPRPEVNQRVAGHEVDMLFRDCRLVVELDGYEYHRDRAAFERDRERDADTLAAGFATVRVTWRRLSSTPAREAARLTSLLRQRDSDTA